MDKKFYEKFEKKASPKKAGKANIKNSDNRHKKVCSDKPERKDNPDKIKSFSKKTHEKNNVNKKYENKNFTKVEELFNTDKLSKETKNILQNFDEIVQGIRPLNSKQLQQLPDNIKQLSHQLTDKRNERRLGYMNDNIQLSSYVRYYTWWNLVRLTRLFSSLPDSAFPNKDSICIDLGTGPLTVISALWLARPELRKLKLTWYCLDLSSNSMIFGEDIYMSIAARTAGKNGEIDPWNIIRVKGSFGTSIRQKADFITSANMFNELDQAGDMPPEYQCKKYFKQLQTYGTDYCKFLLIEPGVPKATRTLTLLREHFINAGKKITAPCPHYSECPMNGFKAYTGSSNKWCNFCFSTENAPAKLLKLSEQAKLPKERATLIFISAINDGETSEKDNKETEKNILTCRITSDPFRLPDYKVGYYGCSRLGLTLIKTNGKIEKNPDFNKQRSIITNEKSFIIKGPLSSGDLIQVKIKTPESNLEKDKKSGAIVISI